MNGIEIESVKKDEATIVNNVPYAKFVNDGTVNMTARKFMGESKTLTNKINANVEEQINKILNIR
jgi:phage gpG-like protein